MLCLAAMKIMMVLGSYLQLQTALKVSCHVVDPTTFIKYLFLVLCVQNDQSTELEQMNAVNIEYYNYIIMVLIIVITEKL